MKKSLPAPEILRMSSLLVDRGPRLALVVVLALTCGCDDGVTDRPVRSPAKSSPEPTRVAAAKKVVVGTNVDLEVSPGKRRVLVYAEVCLRQGPLEQLLTRKNRKEHEAILAAEVDARKVHEALILAGAKEGKPVQWLPQYQAAVGTPIKITLTYLDKHGREKTVPARSWIKDLKTGKEMSTDWVFAGSRLIENPLDKDAPKHYLANDGDVICICNFESALLDVPVQSSKADADRGFEAWTDRIPPVGTKVVVALEPMLPEKKK